MDAKTGLLQVENEGKPPCSCDRRGPMTVKGYLRAQKWQWWWSRFLMGFGALSFGAWTGRTYNDVPYSWALWGGKLEVGERAGATAGWKWSEIQPSTNLVWHQCYEEYDCTRLEVPLDWLDLSNPRRANIAIIRYNATDRIDYKGPVFINPGGPGGSGVWFIKHLAPYYQSVVGRNHDIISFDPRGVGFTTPQISCWNSTFSSPSPSSYLWDLSEPPVLDAHPGIIYDSYAHAAAFSQQCSSLISETGRYVSTPSVARDMLHITEKLGLQKLKYWGFSYGTFLGTTFASMFPDKVGRMVNDGNVDARDYVSGRGTHFLADTDKVMNSFYTFCHLAGPTLCAFHASSPSLIAARLTKLLSNIKKHPIIVPSSPSSNPRPEIVSYSKLRRLITSALYRPLIVFPSLAEVFLALEKGNGRPFVEMISQGSDELSLCQSLSPIENPTDPENPTPEVPEAEGSADASKAILCSDWERVEGGVEEFEAYVEELMTLSESAGATMTSLVMGCVGWQVSPKWRFSGPFEGNTSHPILFIANTADNVTPLRSARANAAGFPGSVVMIQDSYGHTSLSCPSHCTARTINAYFQTGALPPPNTTCPPDLVPFEPWKIDAASTCMGEDEERKEGCAREHGEEPEEVGVALRELMMAPIVGLGRL